MISHNSLSLIATVNNFNSIHLIYFEFNYSFNKLLKRTYFGPVEQLMVNNFIVIHPIFLESLIPTSARAFNKA